MTKKKSFKKIWGKCWPVIRELFRWDVTALAVFIALKFMDYVSWPWPIVLLPIWGPIVIYGIYYAIKKVIGR